MKNTRPTRVMHFIICGFILYTLGVTQLWAADTVAPSGQANSPNIRSYLIGGGSTSGGCSCDQPAGIEDVTGIATDDDSGVKSVAVQIRHVSGERYWDGSGWRSSVYWNANLALSGDNWSLPSVEFDQGGVYHIKVSIVDNDGNRSRSSDNPIALVTVKVDNDAPSVSYSAPTAYRVLQPDGSVTLPKETFTIGFNTLIGKASDADGIGVSNVYVSVKHVESGQSWDGATWSSVSYWNSVNYSPSSENWSLGLDFSRAGMYQVRLSVRDFAGNRRTSSENARTDLMAVSDTTPPTSTLISPAASAIYYPDGSIETNQNVVGARVWNVLGTAVDEGCGVTDVRIQIEAKAGTTAEFGSERRYWNGISWQASPYWLTAELYTPFGQLRWRLLQVDLERPGTYRVRMRLEDAHMNVSNPGANSIFEITTVQ